MKKAKILGHEGFIIGKLESSQNDGFKDMIRDEFGNVEYIDVTTIEDGTGDLDIAIKDLQEKLNWYSSANMNSFKLFLEHEKSLKRAIDILENANRIVF